MKLLMKPLRLQKLLIGSVLRRLAGGELFLVMIFLLAELFSSLWRFLASGAEVGKIFLWVAAGIPRHSIEVFPVAFLFALTMSLSELQANGELMVIYSSGVSLRKLNIPVFMLAVASAFAIFGMNEYLAIPATVQRDNLYQNMLGAKTTGFNPQDITILAQKGQVVYRCASFNPLTATMRDIDILERDESGAPSRRILADSAKWTENRWLFSGARVFSRTQSNFWTELPGGNFSDNAFSEPPESFAMITKNPAMMRLMPLKNYISFLINAGLPSVEAEIEYNKRFSTLLTIPIVFGLSLVFSGLFRKNILLMSLLFSLGTATVYYVAQMLGSLAAKSSLVSPFFGVWSITILFSLLAGLCFYKAKT